MNLEFIPAGKTGQQRFLSKCTQCATPRAIQRKTETEAFEPFAGQFRLTNIRVGSGKAGRVRAAAAGSGLGPPGAGSPVWKQTPSWLGPSGLGSDLGGLPLPPGSEHPHRELGQTPALSAG